MVNKCKEISCKKGANFNNEGEKAKYCKGHSKDGMINVKTKKCIFSGCTTVPNFNYDGETKRLYCKRHSLKGMITINIKKCDYNGCTHIPIFNYEGEKMDYIVTDIKKLK